MTADEMESDGYRRYALLYKEWRQLIHTGVLWRGYAGLFDTGSGSSQPRSVSGTFMISQLAMPDYTLPGILRFPGLAAEVRYRLRLLITRKFSWLVKVVPIPCVDYQSG